MRGGGRRLHEAKYEAAVAGLVLAACASGSSLRDLDLRGNRFSPKVVLQTMLPSTQTRSPTTMTFVLICTMYSSEILSNHSGPPASTYPKPMHVIGGVMLMMPHRAAVCPPSISDTRRLVKHVNHHASTGADSTVMWRPPMRRSPAWVPGTATDIMIRMSLCWKRQRVG